MPAVAKICTVCGQDVAGKKRVKDPEGHYFCESCFQSKKLEVEARLAGAPAAPSVSLAAEAPPTAAPADDGLLDLAPEPTPAKEEPMFGCAGCKRVVPQRQVRNIDGEFLCSACATKRNAPARPAPKPRAGAAEVPESDENVERWYHSLSGGMLVSAGVAVLAFVIMTALYYFLPAKGAEHSPGFALLMGAILTVFIVFKAGGLILSMLMAARIMGGISFGFLGPVTFKSLTLVTGMAVFDFFVDRSEAMFMLGFGFRWGILLVALIVLFGIDYFEAMLLSVINIFMMWALTIAAGAMLITLALGARGGTGDRDEDIDVRPPAHVQPAPADGGQAQPDHGNDDD